MRYELGDYSWAEIKPMLPNKPRSVARVNDRRVLNGIFWACAQVPLGVICRRVTDLLRPATTALSAGAEQALGTGSWRR